MLAVPGGAKEPELDGPVYGPAQGAIAYGLNWSDNWKDTPRAATSWQWEVTDGEKSLAHGNVATPGVAPLQGVFEEGGDYTWLLTASNAYGAGPTVSTPLHAGNPSGPPPKATTPTLTATISSDDTVTISGSHFNASKIVYLQATIEGTSQTPGVPPNNTQDVRNQHLQVTADGTGSFKGFVISPKGFQAVLFENNETKTVWAGETIAVVAANDNVGNFSPGPGVSNIVKEIAPTTI